MLDIDHRGLHLKDTRGKASVGVGMECLPTENATETPIESKKSERREDSSTEEVIDRWVRKSRHFHLTVLRAGSPEGIEYLRLSCDPLLY